MQYDEYFTFCFESTVKRPILFTFTEVNFLSDIFTSIRKEKKYVDLGARYFFEPIAVNTLAIFNASARHLDDLGRKISENTGEARETSFLYQRISILVQRFNAVPMLCMTVCEAYVLHRLMTVLLYFLLNFLLPRNHIY